MAMVRKKQDDKYLEALRELITTGGGNRQCFDCGQKGPTYVNMTIGSFVCTRCSGVLRGITPPHRVKSISMATFTQDEIDFLKAHGNDVCAKTWLGLWDPKRVVHQDQRELMIDKYERKRYFLEPASPLKSLTNATNLKTTTTSSSATASTASSSNSNNNRSSSNNSNTNSNNNTHIQLTPPTSQRTTANGLHKTSSTAISRPQHSTPQQNGFSLSSSYSNTDAFGLHNGLNTSVGSASTGALSDTSSCASANGFGAEADFVADFGSADIFNATVASSPASSIASSTTNNGYAKIQPLKMASTAQQQFMNGHHGGNNSNLQNSTTTNGNTENFADFDHAPIYNAAVEEPLNYQFIRKNAIRKKSTCSVTGGSIIQKNERHLKDILEIDNNERTVDYMNFMENELFRGTTGPAMDYSNLFDDFDTFLSLKRKNENDNRHTQERTGFESNYMNVMEIQQQQQQQTSMNATKFTPLALAAHATAMAVLGNQSHFNTRLDTSSLGTKVDTEYHNQWDVWPSITNDNKLHTMSKSLSWYPSNNSATSIQQQKQQQHLYGSITNENSVNFETNQRQQHHYQHLPSCTFPSAASSSATISFTTAPPVTAGTHITPETATTTTATTTTSMFNKNILNSTNPFRMHLDVNDNNININKNAFETAATTFLNNHNNNNNNNNSDLCSNCSNFNFVSNSILSANCCDFHFENLPSSTTTSNTYHNCNNNDYISNNSHNNNHNYFNTKQIESKNPFYTSNLYNQDIQYSTFNPSVSNSSCLSAFTQNPSTSPPDPYYSSAYSSSSHLSVVDDTKNNNVVHGRKDDVANNVRPSTNILHSNSKTTNFNNSYCNNTRNNNNYIHNNDISWRLPNNNNNNNSSAAAEDRYAALKDLDEQLRESKAVAAHAAQIVTTNVVNSGFGNSTNNGTVNPFATHQQHQQQTSVANPFQNNNNTQNATQQLFGQMTLIPNGIAAANGFLNTQKAQTNAGFFNYTANGFTNTNTAQMQHQQQATAATMYPSALQAGPNGCGFGFGTLQQQIASNGTGLTTNTFNNPFAATGALNSNNPFL